MKEKISNQKTKKLKDFLISNKLTDLKKLNKVFINSFYQTIDDCKKLSYIDIYGRNDKIYIEISEKIRFTFGDNLRILGYYKNDDLKKAWIMFNDYQNKIDRIII